MGGGIEAAGDIVTAGLVGRAVEPAAGESQQDGQGPCLNCGAQVAGKYCHECGQSVRVHRTLTAFWHDFTHSILHFEGKIWRTLPLLFFRPGQLTRRYVNGERARFVSPLALFLFSVFLMFATFSWVGMPLGSGQGQGNALQLDKAAVSAELARTKSRLAKLEKERAPSSETAEVRDQVRRLEAAEKLADGADIGDLKLAKNDINLGVPELDEAFRHAVQNPALLLYKMQSNAYKFSWALIPISIPFVWMLFVFRRRFKPYDHAIFVTYSQSFISLFLVVLSIFGRLGPLADWRVPLVFTVPPVHMFVQLRGAYEIGVFSAAWRTIALLVIAFFVLLMFAIILLMLGITG